MDNGLKKIELEELERKIVDTEYLRSDTLTICVLTLESGFKAVGTAATVNPVFYDKTIGEEVAYKKAVDQLYACEGYRRMEERLALPWEEEE